MLFVSPLEIVWWDRFGYFEQLHGDYGRAIPDRTSPSCCRIDCPSCKSICAFYQFHPNNLLSSVTPIPAWHVRVCLQTISHLLVTSITSWIPMARTRPSPLWACPRLSAQSVDTQEPFLPFTDSCLFSKDHLRGGVFSRDPCSSSGDYHPYRYSHSWEQAYRYVPSPLVVPREIQI